MGLTAAASGFVVLLLSVPVVQGEWGVDYTSAEICASKGSTVDMHCTYRYPSTVTTIKERFWFRAGNAVSVLTSNSDYTGRAEYICDENDCTLRIMDLRDSDPDVYKFRFLTKHTDGSDNAFTGSSGVELFVTALKVLVTRVTVNQSYTEAELRCHSSCSRPSYVWLKNGQKVPEEASSYTGRFNPGDNISCALKGHEDFPSPSLFSPKVPSVSVSPSGDIVEGSSVTLNCSSDANIEANYTWYKENLNPKHELLSDEPQLVFSSIQSSDSGQYYCAAENELGRTTSEYISVNVKYAPKTSTMSVGSPGDIVEGSSVILTCSSDANPAATYTWYKNNQTLPHGQEGSYHLIPISSEDRGIYYCKSVNQHGQIDSSPQFIDVQYAPKLLSMSVCPSGVIVEGSSVTLTCSSDANPTAKYSWYKETEDSPKASGQIFIITDFRAEHSGNYYCEAQNRRGSRRSTLNLAVGTGEGTSIAAGTVSAILIIGIVISGLLWFRKRRASKQTSEPEPDKSAQKQPAEQEDNLHYASVHFSKKQAGPLNSDTGPALPQKHKREEEVDSVEYTTVNFNSGSTTSGNKSEEAGVDPAALYSTVNKTPEKHGNQNL